MDGLVVVDAGDDGARRLSRNSIAAIAQARLDGGDA